MPACAASAGSPAARSRRQACSGRWAPRASTMSAPPAALRPAADRGRRHDRCLPCRPATDAKIPGGRAKRIAPLPGSWAATTCGSLWSISRPEVAATVSTPTAETTTAAASRSLSYLLGLSDIRNARTDDRIASAVAAFRFQAARAVAPSIISNSRGRLAASNLS